VLLTQRAQYQLSWIEVTRSTKHNYQSQIGGHDEDIFKSNKFSKSSEKTASETLTLVRPNREEFSLQITPLNEVKEWLHINSCKLCSLLLCSAHWKKKSAWSFQQQPQLIFHESVTKRIWPRGILQIFVAKLNAQQKYASSYSLTGDFIQILWQIFPCEDMATMYIQKCASASDN
jgi:hypothetical protein